MSKAPAMPMMIDAYIGDTTHLTCEEHGAYLLLLFAMWRRNGEVPNSDTDIARMVHLTPAKWRKVKARLEPMLEITENTISQKNLQKIWKNTQEKIAKNKSNGSLGGRPKHNENNPEAKANGFDWDNPNETIPEPEPEPKKGICRFEGELNEVWATVPREVRSRSTKLEVAGPLKKLLKTKTIGEIVAACRAYFGEYEKTKLGGMALHRFLAGRIESYWQEPEKPPDKVKSAKLFLDEMENEGIPWRLAWTEKTGLTEIEARKLVA